MSISEIRTTQKNLSQDLDVLTKQLNAQLMDFTPWELLEWQTRWLFAPHLLKQPEINPDYGIKYREVRVYLQQVKEFLKSNKEQLYNFCNIEVLDNEIRLSVSIAEFLLDYAPRSISRRTSNLLVSAIILKIGVRRFIDEVD